MKCSYCNNEHGIIGDTVCPIKKTYPGDGYVSNHEPIMVASWHVEKYDFERHSFEIDFAQEEKDAIQKYMGTVRKYNKKLVNVVLRGDYKQ